MSQAPKQAQVLTYVVHYRESPDSPQWEEKYYSKSAADGHALRVNLNGGISLVVETLSDDIFNPPLSQKADDEN